MESRPIKTKLAQFGRSLALLLNRAMMYNDKHPTVQQSVQEVSKAAEALFPHISTIVFILNREQFYIDEELLDPRINLSRIATLFKANGIQSFSFDSGMTIDELFMFIGVFAGLGKNEGSEAMKKKLANRGVSAIKINHVLYKKITEDDQVVSLNAFKKMSPLGDAENTESRKQFLDTLLESVLTEEFAKTLNINSLMANPAAVSRNMIAADLAGAGQASADKPAGTPNDDATALDTISDNSGMATGVALDTISDNSGMATGVALDSISDNAGMATGVALDSISDNSGMATGVATAHTAAGSASAAADPTSAPVDPTAGAVDPATGVADSATESVDPTAVSGRAAPPSVSGAMGHGQLLLHQIEVMQVEVQKHLRGEGQVNLADLASAVFDMKKQLLEGIQLQKALGVAYANEAAIIDNVNQLSDQVLVQLIREEYQAGRITTSRLAYLIKRLVPEATELKRLLPQIKAALLSEGMPIAEYLQLLHELRNELQNEELVRILQESSDAIGVDGAGIIQEVRRDPAQAAKLIYLASEIRKSGADESALTDLLVDFVEQQSNQAVRDPGTQPPTNEAHLKKMVTEVGSSLLRQLGRLDVDADALTRMEQRLNQRMDTVLDKMRIEWLNSRPSAEAPTPSKTLTVLQTLERNTRDDEDLEAILKIVRTKVNEGILEENNFSQIHEEIIRQQTQLKHQRNPSQAAGVLESEELMFILEKEIARTKRYGVPFSALAFSLVQAKPLSAATESAITGERVVKALVHRLARILREVDYIGRIGKNKMVAVLPMANAENGKKALQRVLRLVHAKPLLIDGVQVQLRVAGVANGYENQQGPDVQTFSKRLSDQLTDMATRLKNIQVLF